MSRCGHLVMVFLPPVSRNQSPSSRELFLTTALVMVLFTVFLQVATFSWMMLSQKMDCMMFVCVWLSIFHPRSFHFHLRLYHVENDAILKASKLSTSDISCMQGGTIKLMVKTLGIDLEEDRGDVIGLDVQDKVTVTLTVFITIITVTTTIINISTIDITTLAL